LLKKTFVFSMIAMLFLISGCSNAASERNGTAENDQTEKVYFSEVQFKNQSYTSIEEINLQEINSLLNKAERVLTDRELSNLILRGAINEDPKMYLIPESELTMFYRISKPKSSNEVPIVAARFGEGANVTRIHAILWYQDGEWKSQAYPISNNPSLTKKRMDIFEKSPFGSGDFIELRQKDKYLAIIVNMGGGGTHYAQEVQLLKRNNDKWEIAWVPTYDNWEILWDSIVEFKNGIQEFTVHRTDIKDPEHKWTETWKLQGEQYVLVSTDQEAHQ